ncbi:MAG: hypothetical protein V7645_2120 [Actinomycetota bacterium]|jgi:hypothetical protein
MGPVEVEISMSVDGFITGPNEEGAGLGQGGAILHAWCRQDPDGPRLLDEALFATSGPLITSRKIYDGTEGWRDDGFHRMPVFVLTHRPHNLVVKGETTCTFVTKGIESAIATARAANRQRRRLLQPCDGAAQSTPPRPSKGSSRGWPTIPRQPTTSAPSSPVVRLRTGPNSATVASKPRSSVRSSSRAATRISRTCSGLASTATSSTRLLLSRCSR